MAGAEARRPCQMSLRGSRSLWSALPAMRQVVEGWLPVKLDLVLRRVVDAW
jgi:hypothetical protein